MPNGLALCNIHHAAFDASILGVRPDYVVEIRSDVLTEIDGPMLKYGLQASHGERLFVPRSTPSSPIRSGSRFAMRSPGERRVVGVAVRQHRIQPGVGPCGATD